MINSKMRYPKNRKEQSRQKIVETAAQAFNQYGVDGIGIADIMKEAGLTQGAFSGHFSSKEELLRKAIDDGFRRTPFMFPEQSGEPLETLIRGYLSSKHRDDLRHACLIGTLTAEMARHPRRTREKFITHLEKIFATIDSKLPGGRRGSERKQQAMAIFALLAGALQLARVTKGTELSDQILEAGVEATRKLIPKEAHKTR
jgi:TetR/AcrR family transcriptional regulator, transcriptional repressor for nem operon